MVTFDPLFIIDIFSHYFKVTRIQPQGKVLLDQFLVKYVHESFKALARPRYAIKAEPKDKIFGFVTKDINEYRFHLGQLELFKAMMRDKGVTEDFYATRVRSIPIPSPLKARVTEKWKLRDKQPDVVDFLLSEKTNDRNSRLVTLPTGSGKGLCAMWTVCQRQYRTLVLILPTYIEKWVAEIQDITDATKKDIMTVQGGDSLRGLIELGKTGQYNSDFCLISMRTWNDFIKCYQENPRACVEDIYGCAPEDVYELLGIGTVVIDEIHQHFHAVYTSMCFMHVNLTVGLSATFLSNDQFIDNVQKIMFPVEIRFEQVAMDKYIRAYGIAYNLDHDRARNIKTSERNGTMYSQSAFEKSIIKNRELLNRYLNILLEVVENGFMDLYQPGHKLIIFVRTIHMATIMTERLQAKYPTLDVRRYVEQDPYENVIEADIRVTTQQSAGTAVDISGLMTNITMDNMRSPVAAIQCLGRLRKPKSGTPRYFEVFCDNIKKHRQFAKERREILSERVLSWKEFKSNLSL